MKFISLHHHTTYSPLDGFGLPESHIDRAAEVDMEALAVTEHGNISSHVPLEKAAKKSGIKAIFGVELYCGGVDEKNHSQTKNHMTVLAENQQGYRNLTQLVTRTWEQFYYEPTASKEDLQEFKDGLIFLSGCTGSELAASMVGGKQFTQGGDYHRSRRIASAAKSTFGSSYFLEVQAFPELEKVRELNVAMERLSKELRIPLVATCDIHYTKPNENEMQQILHNVRAGNKQTLEEQARGWGYNVPLCHPWSDAYVYARLRATGLSGRAARGAILAAAEIGERCNVTLPKLPRLRYPLPVGIASANDLWRQWIKDGWTYRGFHRLTPSVAAQYRERLKYEMGIIEGKDFLDYFLVVSDIVKFAKDSGIPVGPARGSAAASLVCFLLRITEVNPMLFPNLVFERFIDVTRQDLPDIDLDFDDSRRSEIRDYAVGKYGAGQVSNIGTFTQYRSKNSLEDIARVYRIPKYRVDEVKELLIERSSGDLRASSTVEDTVLMFAQAKAVFDENPDLYKAMALEGNIRGMGVHAAGLVVSSGPLADVCALYTRENKDTGEILTAVSVNKYDAEYLNILKIDILSLKTMGMIASALKLMGMTLDELYAVPLTDKKTIRGFQKNDCVGIFQFDGRAMRNITGELKPDSFKEICDINALARPGPLHNGATSEYIDTKWGRKDPRRYHPLLDRICADTHYQIVYQEQILRIVVEIGLFEWTHAAYIRKIISQKIGEQEFARQWERFWQGAQTHEGMTEEIAHTIWNQCITAGTYAFNAAHCVSYGMLAFWTMWLKQNDPKAFYCASLQKYEKEKALALMQDAERHMVRVLPPSVKCLSPTWTPDPTLLAVRAGLEQIPGIGEKTANNILNYNKQQPIKRWIDLIDIKGIGTKTIEKIEEFVHTDDPFGIHKLERQLNRVRKELREFKFGEGFPVPTHKADQVPYNRGEDEEVIWLGVVTHRNLRDLFELHFSRTGEKLDPEAVKDPDLREWVVLVGVDETETLTITCDRWRYPRFKRALWDIKLDHDLILVRGLKRGFQSRRAIYIRDMIVLDPGE